MRINGVIICLFQLVVLIGHAGQTFSRPPRKSFSPRLPETAVMNPVDTSGETWRQTGVVPTAFQNARKNIQKRLIQQGCVLEKNMSINKKPGQRRELTLWRWEKDKILVMMSELAADRTDLAWGIIPFDDQKLPMKKQLTQLKQGIKIKVEYK